MVLYWTTGGGVNTIGSASSTVIVGAANGAVKWVRATLDVNNGASGKDVKFWTSDDGTTWTQLGATVTSAGTTSIYSGSATLNLGASGFSGPGAGDVLRGKLYRAQVLNGIDGTVAFDANFETAMTAQTVTSFTESSTNAATVTINRTTYNFQLDTLPNLGTAGSLLPTTVGSSTAADSNDAKFLDYTGTPYVYLPGVAGNGMSVPDATNLRITDNLDIRAQIAMDDWTPSAGQSIIGKYGSGASALAYVLRVDTGGTLRLTIATDSVGTTLSFTSTVATGITDGSIKWIRSTYRSDNGSGSKEARFFTSDNGTTWTELGTAVTSAGTQLIFAGTSPVEIGYNSAVPQTSTAKYYRAQIFDGIDGTKVLDVDTSVITTGAATSFTAVTGQTVTINRSTSGRKSVAVTQPTWLFGTDDYIEVNNRYMTHTGSNYLYLPGVASNNASTPDAAALQITGDIDLRVKVAMDDWTPSAVSTLIGRFAGSTTTGSYTFYLTTAGLLGFYHINSSGGATNRVSTVATGFSDGATKWVRVTLDVDNGSTQNEVKFFTSNDGVTWTQLGTTVTLAGVINTNAGSVPVLVGTYNSTFEPSRGKFFRAQVLNGINGTVAFDANFENSITSLLQTSFTESSTNGATVTINRSGSTYRSAGVIDAGYLYPGATNTFANSAIDYLNFGVSDSFTVMAFIRQWGNPSTGRVINKATNSSPFEGWYLRNNGTASSEEVGLISSVSGSAASISPAYTLGQLFVAGFVVNRNTQTLNSIINNSFSSSVSTSALGTLTNIHPLRIGNSSAGASQFADFEFAGAAVFRNATLTTKNIADINNYFQGRD